ncbi:TPA: helix-turn-helix transcriptional regulator [Streptococcus suis]|nr:helix-turn-helix transcriptional regulator [Streptococcus suis]
MILEEFGNTIRNLRTKEGLSQEKFALRIGMDRTYYASVENGNRNISLINIKKISDGFDISISELFRGLDG